MYTYREIENALVFDIETAAAEKDLKTLKEKNPRLAEIWLEKFHPKVIEQELKKVETSTSFLDENGKITFIPKSLDEDYIYQKGAGLYPEFAKVICISVGLFLPVDNSKDSFQLDITNISNDNESSLLNEFKTFIDSLTTYNLAGFNIKGFDIPFLCKRYLINRILLPTALQIKGKKPWEMKFNDLMDDWKFGAMNNTSLDLLVTCLGIQTPKDGIQNHQVGMLYYADKANLKKISDYCGKDVKATMETMLQLSNLKAVKLSATV